MNSPIIERWTARLENWALFVTSGTSQKSQGVSTLYRGGRITFETFRPRALIGDASDVDRLVCRLDPDHQRALVATFIWTGTIAERAESLGVHPDTLRARTRAAIFRLDDLEQAQRTGARNARQREADALIGVDIPAQMPSQWE